MNISAITRPDDADIVIFGASGDLSKRKLLPALAHMYRWNLIAPGSRIIGVVRSAADAKNWREMVHAALLQYAPDTLTDTQLWQGFARMLLPVQGDLEDPQLYTRLSEIVEDHDTSMNALFYFAIPPAYYHLTARSLHHAGLTREDKGWRRLVIEKPFGMDLDSARQLNRCLLSYFEESQIYRIDHYLGKESVQNLLAFRFANAVFEPLWNRNYIDHVQITVAESIGIEYRGKYYEKAGALRDMVQNHLLQLMSLVAMEPPAEISATGVRNEKLQVLQSIHRMTPDEVNTHAVRAQYGAGMVDGEPVRGYRWEPDVAHDSNTETFVALKMYIDNWRWQGVPFFLRTGKRLPARVSEIAIRFRQAPLNMFKHTRSTIVPNELVFRLQPNAGMSLSLNAKKPGLSMRLHPLQLDAPYVENEESMPEAYETLLYDVLLGDATLFNRADEVEEAWKVVTPIMQVWRESPRITLYPAATWDIPGMDELIAGHEGGWRVL